MMQTNTATALAANTDTLYLGEKRMLVTMRVMGQLFGIPVERVQDVLRTHKVARIPLAPAEVAGAINLRGRIVTVIDIRKCLHLAPIVEGTSSMFVVVEQQGELYSLMVDSVGEVMNVPVSQIENSPVNLQGSWRDVADGVCRLQQELLVILNINALLSL